MSLTSSSDQLAQRVQALWLAVCELVVTVHEDRPQDSDLALVDDLAEKVSELQSDVDAAQQLLRSAPAVTMLPASLPEVTAALDRASTRYWRDLRGYEATRQLRATARSRGRQWQAWRRSVEQAEEACEEPLQGAVDALREAWSVLAELVALRLLPAEGIPAGGHDIGTTTRTP